MFNARSYFSSPYYKIIERSKIDDVKFNTALQNGEDALFMFSIAPRCKKMRLATVNAVYYRRVRSGSLTTCHKTFAYKISLCAHLVFLYVAAYFKSPFSYDFLFFCSRIFATLRNIFLL